ncbi:MAG: TonB-dependent receptor plug domain-containing protein, partial [Bacteroidota bacterium]|nr:TonB-dependent receptor plug domain-containing protein [Bacteroidota bacterium]
MGFLILWMSMYQVAAQVAGMKYAVKDLYFAQAISGAKILVNQKDSLVSDESGNFSLTLPDSGSVMIQVAAVGYNSKTLLVKKSQSLYTIFLNPVNYETNFIQVRGLYNGKDLFHTPGSIANLVVRDLERNNHIDITQSFNLLPGVRMEFRSINTGARIILRGYGNQNNFNGIGYKAYYNDIPLTDADGTTNLDDIDFATLGRVEVFRGPVSSVYGTGIGGVVSFLSEKAPEGISARQSVLTGSDHTYRYTSSVGVGNGNANIQFNYG